MAEDNKKEIKNNELNQVNAGESWGTFLENGDIICYNCGHTFNKNRCKTTTIGLGCSKHTGYICPQCDARNHQY